MTTFILATHNTRKIAELDELLQAFGHRGQGCESPLPQEGSETLAANALAKAQAVHAAHPGAWVIGDDSGLFLKAVPDRLGVRTARELPQAGTNDALQALLGATAERRARLVSVLALVAPSGAVTTATGQLDATVAPENRGTLSRGFDRVLIPRGEALTLAEMTDATRRRYLPRQRALMTLFA